MTTDVAPHARYYRTCEGSWRAPLELRVTDWGAFWRAPMAALDRLRVLSFALWPRAFGDFDFVTSVDASRAGDGVVVHTTRVRRWGVTWFDSVETIALAGDGRSFTLTGTQRLFPTRDVASTLGPCPGRVRDDARGAEYELSWFGTPMHQTGELVGDEVRITQRSDWGGGVQQLRRTG